MVYYGKPRSYRHCTIYHLLVILHIPGRLTIYLDTCSTRPSISAKLYLGIQASRTLFRTFLSLISFDLYCSTSFHVDFQIQIRIPSINLVGQDNSVSISRLLTLFCGRGSGGRHGQVLCICTILRICTTYRLVFMCGSP